MKKLYFYLAALATAATATAAQPANIKTATAEAVKSAASIHVRTGAAAPASKIAKAPAADYAGYTWTLKGDGKYQSSAIDPLYTKSNDPVDVKIYEADGHPGVYKAVGVWAATLNNTDGELIVDASDPDFITVPKQNTGIDDTVDGITYIASQTWVLSEVEGYTKQQIIAGAAEILPTLTDGCINFPAKSLVVNWPEAPADSEFETDPDGWYFGSSTATGFLLLPGGTYVDPWEELGDATVSGDMFCDIFGYTPSDYTVKVFKSTSNDNLFKIANPLAGLYAAGGFNGESPAWEIDATDPDNIILPLTPTGLGSQSQGSFYALTDNQAYEDVDDPEAIRATFKDDEGNLTFTFPAHSLLAFTSITYQLYNGNSVDTTIKLTKKTDGIQAIGTAEGAARYYNLQGMEVNEPAAGQLLIRVQGKNATKILVK